MYRKSDVDRVHDEAEEFVAANDRFPFAQYLSAIEKYTAGNSKVLIGYKGKYLGLDGGESSIKINSITEDKTAARDRLSAEKLMNYEVVEIWYGGGRDIFDFVRELADHLYNTINDPFVPRDTLVLQTAIKYREYNLNVFARQIAHIVGIDMLQQSCVFPLMKPIQVDAIFAEGIKVRTVPSLIWASDIYAKLYNPNSVGELEDLLKLEKIVFADLSRGHTGNQKSHRNDKSTRENHNGKRDKKWYRGKRRGGERHNNDDIDTEDDLDAFDDEYNLTLEDSEIIGGRRNTTTNLNVKTLLSELPGSVLVGVDGLAELIDEETLGNLHQPYPTVLVSATPDEVETWLSAYLGEPVYKSLLRTFALNDFRLMKYKYQVGERGGEIGSSAVILETYNSPSYELIPTIVTSIGNVGTPQVIARFATISMWISALDGRPIGPRRELYIKARNAWLGDMFLESYSLDPSLYVGIYTNPAVARKKLATAKVAPYYPVRNRDDGNRDGNEEGH